MAATSVNELAKLFPISRPMVGSIIPGKLQHILIEHASFRNLSTDYRLKRDSKPIQVLKPHIDVDGAHTSQNPMLSKLLKMLRGDKPKFHPGYEQVKEDLNWRGKLDEKKMKAV